MPREFDCPNGECEFAVRSADDDEVIDAVQRHARERHDQTLERADIEQGIRSV